VKDGDAFDHESFAVSLPSCGRAVLVRPRVFDELMGSKRRIPRRLQARIMGNRYHLGIIRTDASIDEVRAAVRQHGGTFEFNLYPVVARGDPIFRYAFAVDAVKYRHDDPRANYWPRLREALDRAVAYGALNVADDVVVD
jgi:hypothetical protein